MPIAGSRQNSWMLRAAGRESDKIWAGVMRESRLGQAAYLDG
jgi:hypothetical protein